MYLLTNDKESKLGTTPLPDGTFASFRQNGHDGLSFLVAQPIKYVPIGDKIELNLGTDPEVIFDLVKLRTWRDDLWMQVNGADIFRRVDQPGVQIEVNSSVAGWDDHTAVRPAGAKLHEEADRPGDPPGLWRPRGLPQRTGGQES